MSRISSTLVAVAVVVGDDQSVCRSFDCGVFDVERGGAINALGR
jgi:hypothetical protein